MSYNSYSQSGYGQGNPYAGQGDRYQQPNSYQQQSYTGGYQTPQNPYDRQNDIEMGRMNQNQNYGNSSSGYQPQQQSYNASQPQNNSMAILDACDEVDRGVDQLSGAMDRLQSAQRRALSNVSGGTNAEGREVDVLNADIMTQYKSLLNRMKWIKSRPGAGDDRNSMQVGKADRKLRDTYRRYQTLEYEYEKKMRDGIERQYRITRPDATDQEVREAVEDPNQQVFMNALMRSDRRGESRMVLSAVRDRHEAIQKIERQMTELAKMFQELEAITIQQDSTIQKVEQDAEQTNEHVVQANLQLDSANKSAAAARKKKWICLGITVAIIIIIIIIVVVVVLVMNHH